MDDHELPHLVESEAIRAEGLDPDDPAVRAALDLVRWELELSADGPVTTP
jgi:hypothetical protein